MQNKRLANSTHQKIASGFDYKSFELPRDTGKGTALFVYKAWGKKANLICYFKVNGRKIKLSAWQRNNYGPEDGSIDFAYENVGSQYEIQWATKNGKFARFISATRI